MEKEKKLSCVDCMTTACDDGGRPPVFCRAEALTEAEKQAWLTLYGEETNRKVTQIAAEIEYEGYCKWSRVQETIEFAKRLDAKKIGIATCVGLLRESRTLAEILRSYGFQVYGIGCKVGSIPKTDVGIHSRCMEAGEAMCNPIMQAEILNQEGTDLNIVMGLCVGHDSLFYKYSEAITTTLVVKDRVTGHNPVAALYTAKSYYSKLKNKE